MRSARSAVVGDGHAAFAGRDRLVRVEREAGDGGGLLAAALPRARPATAARPPERRARRPRPPRGRVPAPSSSSRPTSIISAADVHRDHAHDPACPAGSRREAAGPEVGELALGIGEIHVQGDRVAVDEDRNRARYRTISAVAAKVIVGTRTPSPACRPSASTARCSAAVQEFTATAWPRSDRGGELFLEPPDPGPGRQPSRAQSGDDLVDLAVGDVGTEKGNLHFVTSAWPPAAAETRVLRSPQRSQNRTRPFQKPKP